MRKSRLLGTLGAGLVVAAAATTFAFAHGGDAALIHACVAKANGDMRIVAAAEECRSSEYALDWNQKGEPGAPGAGGAAGPAGPAGADGAEGPAGRDGRDGRDGAAGGAGEGVVSPRGVGTISITGQIQGPIGGGQQPTGGETMEILSYSHEIASPRDAASGLPTGKRQHKPFTIVKHVDKATPLLMQALTRNETLTDVVIAVDRPGSAGYFEYTLENASISSWSTSSSAHTDTQELETISFTYQRIEVTFVNGGITAEDDWSTPVS